MGATQSSLDEYDLDMDSTLDACPGPTVRALLTAVLDGDVRRLKDMVRTMDVEDRAKLADMYILKGVGLLGMASYIPQMKVCKYLVEELGLDVNAGGSRGGNEAVLRLLLSRGARVDIDGVHGTPLHTASSYGTIGALKILLDHHADPNRVSEVSGTPLITALDSTKHGLSESDSLNCVKLLVKDEPCNKAMDKIAMLKSRGEKAVKRNVYLGASKLYSEEHKKALDALLGGLKLEPANAEIEKVLWEALEALKKDHVAGGSLESTD